MKITSILLLAACLALPACERGSRAHAASESAEAARDQYQNYVSGRLKEFDNRFDGLEARMKGLDTADQQRLSVDINELRDRKKSVAKKFDDLKGVSDASWQDLRSSIDADLVKLEQAYNVVSANNLGYH